MQQPRTLLFDQNLEVKGTTNFIFEARGKIRRVARHSGCCVSFVHMTVKFVALTSAHFTENTLF
jgi:hypothetical protein